MTKADVKSFTSVSIPFISRRSRELTERSISSVFCLNPFHLTGEQGTIIDTNVQSLFCKSQSLSSHGEQGTGRKMLSELLHRKVSIPFISLGSREQSGELGRN
jgi:hypothetical protein